MDPHLREIIDLVLRWVHLIAGIMWVGNSMLFNWLDRNLFKPKGGDPNLVGKIWMVHSGGFYEIDKKFLAPSQMPETLHWFKWQSYITWMSGILLLGVVYHTDGGAYLMDPGVSTISSKAAHMMSVALPFGGFLLYDLLWRSPLRKIEPLAIALSLGLGVGAVWIATHTLSGRAAFIHVGAMLGTLMAGNVFFHIIPSQRELVRATVAGQPQDEAIAWRAKQRSIHNNYMTFPLLFTMVSNHFPGTYGTQKAPYVLLVLFVTGALIRHFMNIRFTFRQWIPALVATVLVGGAAVVFLVRPPKPAAAMSDKPAAPVSFVQVHAIIETRCVPCHSKTPSDKTVAVPPNNVMFDTPEQIRAFSERIRVRAIEQRTMPLANKTQITDQERETVGAWIAAGAPLP